MVKDFDIKQSMATALWWEKEWQTQGPGFDTDSEKTTKMQALQDGRAINGGEKDFQTRSSEIGQLTPPVFRI